MSAMQATRRRFLAFLGGAAAAGPSAAKATMQSLDLGAVGVNLRDPYDGPPQACVSGGRDVDWAADRLRSFKEMLPANIDRQRREFVVRFLDADTAALRSVSLVRKIERTRDKEFERARQSNMTYWQGVIDGLWD